MRERARIIMVLSARPYAKKTWKKMENDEVGMNEGNEGYFYFTTKQKLNTHEASTRQAVQLSLENQNALKQALKQQSESLEALVKRTNLQDESSRRDEPFIDEPLASLSPAADLFSTIASNLARPVALPAKTPSSGVSAASPGVSSAAQHIAESGRRLSGAACSLPPIFPLEETKNPSQKISPSKETR